MPKIFQYPTPSDLQLLRHRLGLTLTEFAARVGCHRNTVHRWEQGKSVPRGSTRSALIYMISQVKNEGTAGDQSAVPSNPPPGPTPERRPTIPDTIPPDFTPVKQAYDKLLAKVLSVRSAMRKGTIGQQTKAVVALLTEVDDHVQ